MHIAAFGGKRIGFCTGHIVPQRLFFDGICGHRNRLSVVQTVQTPSVIFSNTAQPSAVRRNDAPVVAQIADHTLSGKALIQNSFFHGDHHLFLSSILPPYVIGYKFCKGTAGVALTKNEPLSILCLSAQFERAKPNN
jgi:hypothetical protein